MSTFFYKGLSLFFICLEVILLIYIFCSWLIPGEIWAKYKKYIDFVVEPIFVPIRHLMKYSIIYSPIFDLSPIITVAIVIYLQQLFGRLQ